MATVDLITGFLGAGKTTFLQRYGDYLRARGVSFAVIENDFSTSGVDSLVLSRKFDGVRELSGGCICCTLRPAFMNLLCSMADRYQRILIEPSGIFQLDDFLGIVRGGSALGGLEAGMCLTILDPRMLLDMDAPTRALLEGMLLNTGRVVWSKTDLEPPVDEDAARAALHALFGSAPEGEILYPVPTWRLGDADFAALMEARAERRAPRTAPGAHSLLYQSCGVPIRRPVSRGELEDILHRLLADSGCGAIQRIKGILPLGDTPALVSYAQGGGLEFLPGDYEKTTRLSVIGHGLDLARILSYFPKELRSGAGAK